MAFSNLVALAIIVTTAATLHAAWLEVAMSVTRRAEALRPVARAVCVHAVHPSEASSSLPALPRLWRAGGRDNPHAANQAASRAQSPTPSRRFAIFPSGAGLALRSLLHRSRDIDQFKNLPRLERRPRRIGS